MANQEPAFEKCPQAWIEERDIEGLSFEKATWIPLFVEKVERQSKGRTLCRGFNEPGTTAVYLD